MKKIKFNINTITKIGILGALATVLMLFQIPLWFAPGFYKVDLSGIPALIGGFALGPVAGMFIELIKVLLNFVIDGSNTGGVGELSNFIVGCSFVVSSAWIYKYKKSRKNAIVSLSIGVIAMIIVGSLSNYFFILPIYSSLGIMPLEAIINAGNALNKYIVNMETFVLYAVAPFNLVKGLLNALLTILLYKRLSKVLHK